MIGKFLSPAGGAVSWLLRRRNSPLRVGRELGGGGRKGVGADVRFDRIPLIDSTTSAPRIVGLHKHT